MRFVRIFSFRPSATFVPAVRITLKYGPVPGTKEKDLQVWYYRESTGRWEFFCRPTIDRVNDKVSFTTSHFSEYAIVAPGQSHPAPCWVWTIVGLLGELLILAVIIAIIVSRRPKSRPRK